MVDHDKIFLQKVRPYFARMLDERKNGDESIETSSVPDELHGAIADAMFIDKVGSDSLTAFLLAMLYARQDTRSPDELIVLLQEMVDAMDYFQENAQATSGS